MDLESSRHGQFVSRYPTNGFNVVVIFGILINDAVFSVTAVSSGSNKRQTGNFFVLFRNSVEITEEFTWMKSKVGVVVLLHAEGVHRMRHISC